MSSGLGKPLLIIFIFNVLWILLTSLPSTVNDSVISKI